MKRFILAGLALTVAVAFPARAADLATLEKALEAAKLATDAARRAEDAAIAAKVAAQAAQDAAAVAKAAAKAAGLPDVAVADAKAPPMVPDQKVAQPADPASKPAGKSDKVDGPSAYLTANTDGGNATIRYDWYRGDKQGDASGRYVNQALSLSSPLSSGAKSVDVASLDGLGSGASVAYTLTMGNFASNFLPNADPVAFLLAGVQARVGYRKYKFINPSSLKNESSENYSQSVAPYVAYASPGSVIYIAKFDYQRAYKEADATVLCPQAQAYPVSCVNGAAGQPKQQVKRIFTLTSRFFMGEVASAEVNLSYDRASRVKGIDVPVYFLQPKDTNDGFTPYNAGIRLGWRSDTKDPSLGIFVGSPFKFWGL